jgi:hypothetical protein
MREDEGYIVLHNGVPRTFRDTKAAALDAASYAKGKARNDIIEILDRSTGTKSLMLEDGRLG